MTCLLIAAFVLPSDHKAEAIAEARARREATIAAVLEAGGSLIGPDDTSRHHEAEPFLKRWPVVGVDLHGVQVDEKLLRSLASLPSLNRLYLTGCGLTDTHLPHLLKLPRLRRLALWENRITDAAGPVLARLPLAVLDITETDITPAIVPDLARLRRLESLAIDITLDGEALRSLGRSPNVSCDELRLENVTDADLLAVPPRLFRHLAVVSLMGCRLSARGLARFAQGPLREVTIVGGEMTVSDLAVLPRGHLERLVIGELDLPPADLFGLFDRGFSWLSVTRAEWPGMDASTSYFFSTARSRLPNEGWWLRDDYLTIQTTMSWAVEATELANLPPLRDFTMIAADGAEVVNSLRSTDLLEKVTVSAGQAPLNVRRIPNVRELTLRGMRQPFTDLRALPALHTLTVSLPPETTSLDGIESLRHLRNLRLESKTLADDDLAPLASLRHLRNLTLVLPNVRGPGLSAVRDLPELTHVRVESERLGDEAMPHLAAIPKLRFIAIPDSEVTNEGMRALHRKPTLQTVEIYGTAVTQKGYRRWKESQLKMWEAMRRRGEL